VTVGAFLTFVGVSALVIVTPGQDTALTIGNTLNGGRTGGVFTALGVATGQAAWTLAASAGLAALLIASEPAFFALKVAGGTYLVLLGGQALLRARCGCGHPAAGPRSRLSCGAAYRRGLAINLGNPKMAVFFTSLLPQFAPEGGASLPGLIALGLLFSLLTLVWLTGYALAVAKAGELLRRPSARRLLDAVTGTVLVAFGIRLAAERR
jgi:threonine/homoserine/homoserine lactone efflux protein